MITHVLIHQRWPRILDIPNGTSGGIYQHTFLTENVSRGSRQQALGTTIAN